MRNLIAQVSSSLSDSPQMLKNIARAAETLQKACWEQLPPELNAVEPPERDRKPPITPPPSISALSRSASTVQASLTPASSVSAPDYGNNLFFPPSSPSSSDVDTPWGRDSEPRKKRKRTEGPERDREDSDLLATRSVFPRAQILGAQPEEEDPAPERPPPGTILRGPEDRIRVRYVDIYKYGGSYMTHL